MNRDLFRNFLRNSFFLALATVVDRIADFILVIYITRFLSEALVGSYLVAIATLYLFQNLVGFGLSQLATREIARSSVQIERRLAELFIISIVLGSIATGILFLITPWLEYDNPTRLGVYILSASILPGTLRLLTEAVFNALEEMHHIAWVTGFLGAIRSIVSIAFITKGADVSAIFAIYVIAQTLAAFIYLALLVRRFGLPLRQVSIADLRALLKPTMTLTAMSVFVVGSNNVNVVLAARLTTEFEAALLALAIKPVQALILLRPIIMRSLYPSFVRMSNNRELLRLMTEQVGRV
ncbi:MAG: oligosaccharide flippase family protein, partial [Anaerolineales bacterium]|nr:oligosaccharide flippase family protein [Anaerolineales bacterium]